MNLRTTLALLVLAAAGGAVLWVGASLPPALNPAPPPPPAADAGSRDFLGRLKPAEWKSVEIDRRDQPAVVLLQSDGAWTMPGNWPVRGGDASPVKDLTDLLSGLRPRFEPEPVKDNDLGKYGLDKPAVVVKLETADAKHTLAFGRRPAEAGASPFTQDTYVRVDDKPEVLRLGSGLIAELDRPADYYQQRRLFPRERVAKGENDKEKVERLAARSLTVENKKEGGAKFTVARASDGWELSSPARDGLEQTARDALLAAVPDLWAESFVQNDVAGAASVPAVVDGGLPGVLTALFWADVNMPGKAPQWLTARAGLDAPERTVSAVTDDGRTVTLLIGRSAGTRAKEAPRPPADFGAPPPPMEFEEFFYAKLKDNDQVFEIKGDKLKDVFVALDSLRDPRPAHFAAADATRVEISQDGQEIVLAKSKDKDKDTDRWTLDKPLHADADRQKVNDLLNRLSRLEARGKDVIDAPDVKSYGLDQPAAVVKVTVEEKDKDAKDKDKKKTRVLTFRLGKHDDAAKKMYVQVDDWPRVNAVADGGSPGDAGLSGLVKREAREYRGKRLFDFATADPEKITVQRGSEPQFVLQADATGGWRLTASPTISSAPTDIFAASALAKTLTGLEVLEYVNDAPKPDELEAQFGLGKPELVVRMEFADKTKPPRILHVGKKREGKPGRFARLADNPDGPPSSIFAVADDAFANLDRDALAYLPREPWAVVPFGDGTVVRVHRKDQPEYTLTRAFGGWKIAGPFDADASPDAAQSLANSLGAPHIESYKAFDAKQPAEYGLDAPYLTVVLTAKDGAQHTLTIGGPATQNSGERYAQADKNPAVFVVSGQLVAALDKPALSLLDPTLFRLGANRLDFVAIQRKDETIKLKSQPNGWQQVLGPGAPYAADPGAVSRLQNLLSYLKASRFADYGPNVNWKDYGLDPAEVWVVVGFRADDKAPLVEHEIRLGKPADGGGRYARFDFQPGLVVLDEATAKELSSNHLDVVDRTVFNFDANAVTSLNLHRAAGDVEVTKQAGGWKLVKPAPEQADEKSLQDLFARLSHLRADRVAEYPAKNLEAFGLATPEVAMTVQLGPDAKPPKAVLLIGKAPDAAGGERFAMVEGGQAVVVIPAAVAHRLTAGPLAFRDRTLVKITTDPDRIRLERDPRKAVFQNVDGTWKMTEPVKADLDQDALNDFLNGLLTLRADELVSEKPTPDELKTYGLDNPEAKWRLQAGDKDLLTLSVGKMEKNGPRAYARLDGRDMVFLLDPALTAKALGEFRTRTVWATPLDAVGVVGLEYRKAGGGGFELAKGDDGWKAVGKPDAKLDARTVEETLAALAGLKLERYAVDKDANFALFGLAPEPELSVEVRTKTGQHFMLQLGRPVGDSKRRYARAPEPGRTDVFVMSEVDAEKIARDLAAFGKPPAAPAPAPSITP